MNLQILIFKQQVMNLISKSDLPIGVVQLILKDMLNEINILYQNQVQIEQQQLEKQQQKEIELPIGKDKRLIRWEQEKVQ